MVTVAWEAIMMVSGLDKITGCVGNLRSAQTLKLKKKQELVQYGDFMSESTFAYSTGQAKTVNLIVPEIDFFRAIRCQDHSQGG